MKLLKNGIPIFPVLLLLMLITWGTILYAKGYRVDLQQKEVKVNKTGMLYVRSQPEGAKVYVNGVPVTATNSTISSLEPGEYDLKVVKEGFESWEKQVTVYKDLVTDITAVLVLQSPRIEPLTNYGVSAFSMSWDGTRIAYTTKNGKEPGIWIFPLTASSNISIFGGNSNLLIADTPTIAFSLSTELYWSPDDKQIMVKLNDNKYYTFNATTGGSINPDVLEATASPTPTFNEWSLFKNEATQKFIEKLSLDDEKSNYALNEGTLWSYDKKKFMVQVEDGDKLKYKIYNFEKPLPVGEKEEYAPLEVTKGDNIKVYWYTDSYHLLIVENQQTVYLMRVDGSNKTEIFSGTLASNKVFAMPQGDKIVVLASFKQSVPPDLYTVSIR